MTYQNLLENEWSSENIPSFAFLNAFYIQYGVRDAQHLENGSEKDGYGIVGALKKGRLPVVIVGPTHLKKLSEG